MRPYAYIGIISSNSSFVRILRFVIPATPTLPLGIGVAPERALVGEDAPPTLSLLLRLMSKPNQPNPPTQEKN
jgi:hypothetical protein